MSDMSRPLVAGEEDMHSQAEAAPALWGASRLAIAGARGVLLFCMQWLDSLRGRNLVLVPVPAHPFRKGIRRANALYARTPHL